VAWLPLSENLRPFKAIEMGEAMNSSMVGDLECELSREWLYAGLTFPLPLLVVPLLVTSEEAFAG